jgi:hypothetical protein
MGAFARSLRSSFIRSVVVTAALFTFTVTSTSAHAQTDAGKNAAREFAEGQRAFSAGDFQRAGEQFEAAYRDKPHHAPLWNAAKSWDSAGELPRAAGLYARYLREAPADAPDRDAATAALRAISARVVRLEIHPAEGVTGITVDGKPVEGETIYVTPGDHAIDGKKGDKRAHKDQTGRAGDVLSVLLEVTEAPPVAVMPPPTLETAPPPKDVSTDAQGHGLSPIFVVIGSVLTVGAAGVTIWSGVDTLSQKDTFDTERTQANLDDGRAKQTRTNVLLGVTGGLAVITGVTAIFFTDWNKSERAPATGALRAGVGPGTLVMTGSF